MGLKQKPGAFFFYQIAPLPKICSVCSLSQGATFSSSTSCTNVCLFKSKALVSSLRVCVFYDTMSADGDVCCWSCCPCGFVYTCVLHSAASVCVCALPECIKRIKVEVCSLLAALRSSVFSL